ncbi:hypothetical protein BaRGS_00023876 [Batillaria attramentaria]|uniref:Uncharacterized protein n=1 Tax=Batillaria attramentaria TaxID=370345 RepID=A0ABD0KCM7_9CAEN
MRCAFVQPAWALLPSDNNKSMANWAHRSPGYKLGLLLLFVGFLLYVIGYASPFWQYHDMGINWAATGLWNRVACSGTTDHWQCGSFYYRFYSAGWMTAVQAMQCLGLIGLIVSCIYAFVVNCCQTSQTYSRFLEIFTVISGVCGFISTMIYVGKTNFGSYNYYSWGFGLDLTGCILVIVASIVLFIANKPLRPPGPIYQPTANPAQINNGKGYPGPPPAGPYPMASASGAYPQAGVPPPGYPVHL